MLTIGLHFGTYLSEVYRGGLAAVPRAQWEACRALNLSPVRNLHAGHSAASTACQPARHGQLSGRHF